MGEPVFRASSALRLGRRGLAAMMAAALFLGPAAARARDGASTAAPNESSSSRPTFRLVWVRGEGAEDCADAERIAERVSTRIGRATFAPSAASSIEGFVEHENLGYRARLYVRDTEGHLAGTRLLESDAADCRALGDAIALAVALVIDPIAALAPPPTPRASTTLAGPPAGVDVVAAPDPVAAPEGAPGRAPTSLASATPAVSDVVDLAARATVGFGLLPGTSVGAALSADMVVLRPPSVDGTLRISAGALYFPETRTLAGNFAFGLTAVSAGLCVDALDHAPWRLSFCGKGLIGAIHAVVFTLQPLTPGDRLWGAASASAQAAVRLAGPVTLEVGGEGVVPFQRYGFSIQGTASPAFQEPAIAATIFAGLGVSIP